MCFYGDWLIGQGRDGGGALDLSAVESALRMSDTDRSEWKGMVRHLNMIHGHVMRIARRRYKTGDA